jgi:hypothetical protein
VPDTVCVICKIKNVKPNVVEGDDREEARSTARCAVIKCADLANEIRPDHELSKQWAARVMTEFYIQGDLEKQRGQSSVTICFSSSFLSVALFTHSLALMLALLNCFCFCFFVFVGFPVGFLNDRNTSKTPNGQIGFINFLCKPL